MRRLTRREKLIYSAGNFGHGVWGGVAIFWLVADRLWVKSSLDDEEERMRAANLSGS